MKQIVTIQEKPYPFNKYDMPMTQRLYNHISTQLLNMFVTVETNTQKGIWYAVSKIGMYVGCRVLICGI